MSVRIYNVIKNSPADKKKVRAGDLLLSINGNFIKDVLDYEFYLAEGTSVFAVQSSGSDRVITFRLKENRESGLEFETYLMDDKRSCRNNCIFCFIDQLPPGLRESLYFKDDDDRLGFLFGNYITLTNLHRDDIDRIIRMRISPVNISLHTTDRRLRASMMGNDKAGDTLEYIDILDNAGIDMNFQLVLCPGINDGDNLRQTLRHLGLLGHVRSIACVPVGLTCHRQELYKLRPYDKTASTEAVEIISEFNASIGRTLAYAADELYLRSETPLPSAEHYGDFDQYENGVGMLSLFEQQFAEELAESDKVGRSGTISVITGMAAKDFISRLCRSINAPNLNIKIQAIENRLFGESITVSGLVAGRDIIEQTIGCGLGQEVLIPRNMLDYTGRLFVDGMTIEQLSQELSAEVTVVDTDGAEFVRAIIG
ncbi:MAG: DUF512 domain-containing protein [Oscillospiraceae bacterium]|nr:DUF512 domain-containing protein [Oscillospiraceae bacterium]